MELESSMRVLKEPNKNEWFMYCIVKTVLVPGLRAYATTRSRLRLFLVLLLQICYVMIGTDIRRTTKAATTVGLRSSSSSEGFRKAEIIS